MVSKLVMDLALDALGEVENKFPDFSEDVIRYGAGILVEEIGESVKAALDHHYGRSGNMDKLSKETAQAVAKVLRFLIKFLSKNITRNKMSEAAEEAKNLSFWKCKKCEKIMIGMDTDEIKDFSCLICHGDLRNWPVYLARRRQ